MAELRLFHVDAFSSVPFGGNPAGVCLLDGPLQDDWMQAVAAEMALSETAFLTPRVDGYDLRWFTPRVEVDLCGHATLASAHVLWQVGAVDPASPAVFHTRSGVLTARRTGEAIELDLPAARCEIAPAPPEVIAAVGTTPVTTARVHRLGEPNWLVQLACEADVLELSPDLSGLRTAASPCVIVTAASDHPERDFVSRYFAPSVGVDEDPVTGAAHTALAPWWAERLGRRELVGFQASRRGGTVGVRYDGDRVRLRGRAVTFLRGVVQSPSEAAQPI